MNILAELQRHIAHGHGTLIVVILIRIVSILLTFVSLKHAWHETRIRDDIYWLRIFIFTMILAYQTESIVLLWLSVEQFFDLPLLLSENNTRLVSATAFLFISIILLAIYNGVFKRIFSKGGQHGTTKRQ